MLMLIYNLMLMLTHNLMLMLTHNFHDQFMRYNILIIPFLFVLLQITKLAFQKYLQNDNS